MILKSQLFDRALDFDRTISPAYLKYDTGAQHVVSASYKRDKLSVLSNVYVHFNNSVAVRRTPNESFMKYESGFASMLSKFN